MCFRQGIVRLTQCMRRSPNAFGEAGLGPISFSLCKEMSSGPQRS